MAALAIGLAVADAEASDGSNTLVLSGPNATWRLNGGAAAVTHRLPDGRPSGYVLTGLGEMVMSIGLPIEVRQLVRFSEESVADPFTEKFNGLGSGRKRSPSGR